MDENTIVLCAASAYEQKFYLNEDYGRLPTQIKDELKIMCVLFTADVGGILSLVFDEEGKLRFVTEYDEGDLLYDEIGSELKIKQLRETRKELLEALEMYHRVFVLGEEELHLEI